MILISPLINLYKKTFNLMISYTNSKYAIPVLIIVAFTESSFFIIPPDFLLIPMIFANPSRGLLYVFLATTFSTLGGILGYGLGYYTYDLFLHNLILKFGYQHYFDYFKMLYDEYSVIALLIGGFSPFPYKVMSIASGIFNINLFIFIIISIISRGVRFLLLYLVIKFYHKQGKQLILQHFKKIIVIVTIVAIISIVIYILYKIF